MSGVFISYSHKDEPAASAIAAHLKELGLSVWFDQSEVAPGDSFLARMNEGLGLASYLVLLVSPHSNESKWVRKEWMAALASGGTVILPALLSGEMPPLLRDIVYLDFRSDTKAGLRQLRTFFELELQQPIVPDPADRTRGSGPLTAREARLVAVNCLTEYRFLSFLNDASINPGEIAGHSLNERIVNVLHAVTTRGFLDQFVTWMADEDPQCFRYQLNRVRTERQWQLEIQVRDRG